MAADDYRDALAAAHARIAELEDRLEKEHDGGGRATEWLDQLNAARRAVLARSEGGLANPKRRWRVLGMIWASALTLGIVVSMIAGSLLPLGLFSLLAIHPATIVVFSLSAQRRRIHTQELAKIDEKIADVKKMAAIMAPARVRVVSTPTPGVTPAEVDVDALEEVRGTVEGDAVPRTRQDG